jgi:hypothetical protein
MALTDIQKVKLEVADIDPSFPILSDSDYQYFLEKNNNSITRTALDAAKTILLVLSQRTDETVDIFSVKGSRAASEYRMSLQLFLRDPNLNPVYQNCQGWVGGISLEEMRANIENTDNNIVQNAYTETQKFPKSYFEV